MKTLPIESYQSLKKNAEIIERDPHGEKVLMLANGHYLKLFRRKRLISSAAWYPYAQRFVDNAKALEERGIPCPRVVKLFRVSEIARDGVEYEPLPGSTLRDLVQSGLSKVRLAELKHQFNVFVRTLHDRGIYFRSLHLNNVVLTPEGKLGLIDLSDIRVHRGSLSRFWRRRNLRRLEGIPSERDWIDYPLILG